MRITSMIGRAAFLALLPFGMFCLPTYAQQPTPDDVITPVDDRPPLQVLITKGNILSAHRTRSEARLTGSAVSVITAKDIEERQATTVSDILRTIPSVAVSSSGGKGTQTSLRIRGAEANQTLVIIDGIEMNNPAADSAFDMGQLVAADIERIEVLKGPQSSLYGSDAIGGVINITTKKGRGGNRTSAGLEFGTNQSNQETLSTRGTCGPAHYSLGLARQYTGGHSVAPEYQGNTESDNTEQRSYVGKAGYDLTDNLTVNVSGRYATNEVATDSQPSVTGIIYVRDSDVVNRIMQKTGKVSATHSSFDGAWENIVGLSGSETRMDTFTNGRGSYMTDGYKSKYEYQTNVHLYTPAIAAKHTLTGLIEKEDEKQRTNTARLEQDNLGLTGEYRIELFDRLALSGAMRRDDNSFFKDQDTYRLTSSYDHKETGTRSHASIGTGAKNPTMPELYGFGPNFIGNPNLQPETSRGFDLGVEQKFGSDLIVDATFFHNRITDLITGNGNTARNLPGISTAEGLELSATWQATDHLDLRGSYTYTATSDSSGQQLTRRPMHLGSIGSSYRFLSGRARIGATADYNGDQVESQFSNSYNTTTRVEMDSFWLIGLQTSYHLTDNFEIYGRMENLLDSKNEQVFGYAEPGRGVYAGIRANF